MKTDNNLVKFKVCSNHILENKKILSFLLKEFVPPYNSFSVDEISESFLPDEEVKQMGEEVIHFLNAEASYKPKDLPQQMNRVYSISQPGGTRVNELIVSVIPTAESEDEIKEILEASFNETRELFGSMGLWENSVFTVEGNFLSKVINFFVVVFPEDLKNKIISNHAESIDGEPLLNYTIDPKLEPFKRVLPIFGLLLGPYGTEVKPKSLQILDLIFSGTHSVDQKMDLLKERFEITLDPTEEEDLAVITEYCQRVLRESEQE